MARGEAEEELPENPPDGSSSGSSWGKAAFLALLGLFLVAVLAFPGESHEGERQALQSWIPVLISGLLAGLAFAGAGFLLGIRSRPEAAAAEGEENAALEASGEDSVDEEFRTAFASAPDGMALLDGDRIESANAALEALAGVRPGALDGQEVAQLFEAEGTSAGAHEGGSLAPYEAGLKRRDGQAFRVEVNAFPLRWRGRNQRLLLVRDITDRKGREDSLRRSETALRKSGESLRALVAQSPAVFFSFDKDGNFTLAEGKALENMGLKASDLEGQNAFAKSPSHPAAARLRPLQGAIRRALDGLPVDDTAEIAGSLYEIRLRPVNGPDGKGEGAMGVAMDVTELRRAEEELRRSKEHLRTVISNAPLILFALDRKGSYTLSEGRGLEALGLRSGDNVGKSAFDIHRNVPQLALNVRRALSGEEFTSTVQVGSLWFETWYTPVFEGYGEVAGVIGVAINVTDRKRAEDALRRSEEQLRHSRKMEAIGRVAGGVAHDFNNLLTAITGYSELLLGSSGGAAPQAPAQDRKSVEEIRKAAERATVLTRQLLAFSRRQVLTPKVLSLNQVVGEMDSMLRRVIREDIELVTILEPRLGEVWVDPGQIEQVILNLALNARDAMADGPRGNRMGKAGQLTLETANVELEGPMARGELYLVPGSYVMLAVTDTGMGMDEDVKAHLFEPFFTTKAEGSGLGLGLSAVYGIVKQSGGTIAVESEKGKGTTFRVYLPRADKGASARQGAKPPESLQGEETVLLVEDEEAVRTLIREILSMHGYKVLEARSGGEAILVSQKYNGAIHLLLTDVVMANMSGRELAEHLRPLRPEMKILFISGYGEDTVLGDAGGVRGAASPSWTPRRLDAAFLAKPFTPKTLAMKVREVLEAKTALSQDLAQHA